MDQLLTMQIFLEIIRGIARNRHRRVNNMNHLVLYEQDYNAPDGFNTENRGFMRASPGAILGIKYLL